MWDNGDTRATADTLGFGLHSVMSLISKDEGPAWRSATVSPSGGNCYGLFVGQWRHCTSDSGYAWIWFMASLSYHYLWDNGTDTGAWSKSMNLGAEFT